MIMYDHGFEFVESGIARGQANPYLRAFELLRC